MQRAADVEGPRYIRSSAKPNQRLNDCIDPYEIHHLRRPEQSQRIPAERRMNELWNHPPTIARPVSEALRWSITSRTSTCAP